MPNKSLYTSLMLVLLAALYTGCSGQSAQSYVPQSEAAQTALQLVLEAWKGGQPADPAGKLPSGATVRAIDMDWAAGKRLTAFEIVREEPPSSDEAAPRKFVVKLTLSGEAQPVEAMYLVVGIDPLQVFRDKDYDKYFGMSGQ